MQILHADAVIFISTDPAGAALVGNIEKKKAKTDLKGQQLTKMPSVQESCNEKWVHRASAEPKGL